MVRLFLANLVTRLISLLTAWLGWLFGLRINDFSPREGWPGTIITILGNGFSADRDADIVTIGSVGALVIEVDTNRLVVLAGESTVTGPIVVKVGAETATRRATSSSNRTRQQPISTRPAPPSFSTGPSMARRRQMCKIKRCR